METLEQTTATAVAEAKAVETTEKPVSTATADRETLSKMLDTPEAKTQTPEKETKEVKPDTAAAPEISEVEKIKQEFQKEKERLEKQVKDKEDYIRNRQSIIDQQNQTLRQAGMLKQKAQALRAQAAEAVMPAEAAEMVIQARDAEAHANHLDAQTRWYENKEAIIQFAPDYETLVPDIAAICKEKGYPDHVIQQFQAAPFNEPVQMAVAFAEAARMRKQVREQGEQIAALKKTPEQIAKNIAKAAETNPGITASGGGASGGEPLAITPDMVPRMSRAQLKEYLAKK